MVRECQYSPGKVYHGGNAVSHERQYSGCITSNLEPPEPIQPLPIVRPEPECGEGVKGTIHLISRGHKALAMCGAKVAVVLPYVRRKDFPAVDRRCKKCSKQCGLVLQKQRKN